MPRKSSHNSRPPKPVREVASRPPMERMWKIHQKLAAGGFPNCRVMADDMEVSSKTIMRDIEFMRDRLGLPLEYDAVKHGFYYTAPVKDFPVMKVSQGEVAALLLAQQSLEQFRGTPFERPLAGAFRKLSQSLGDGMEVAWHDLEQALSVRRGGIGLSNMSVFDVLAQAVLDGAEVEFAYHKLAGEKPERRVVRPYHLGYIENQWYLFGLDGARGAVRTFALPRVSDVERTGETFRRPKDFSLAKILEGSFAVFEGRNAKPVKLRFRGVAARLIGERTWHPSQKVVRDKHGVLLEMRVGISPDLRQWILGWGAEVEVLSPAELRRAVARAATEAAAVYQDALPR
ncbi:MAG: WYL domain-containing protein [Chthoniobacterales bacterium]|nr:WYL domain-containing protein [Chthoniobacterales bacterium]